MTVSVCLPQIPPRRCVDSFLCYFLLLTYISPMERSGRWRTETWLTRLYNRHVRISFLIVCAHPHVCSGRRWLTLSLMICLCPIWRVISICLSTLCSIGSSCCTYHISQDTLVLNLVLESAILEKTKQYCICTSPSTTHPYVIRLA